MTTLADRAPAVAGTAAALYFDPLSYAAYDHPYELYRRLRDEVPVLLDEALPRRHRPSRTWIYARSPSGSSASTARWRWWRTRSPRRARQGP